MKDIKVGEYVRTKDGRIFNVFKIYGDYNGENLWSGETTRPINYTVKSHSFNIIDIIEEGDYVNGSIVERAGELLGFYSGGFFLGLKRIGIYSIVTHEQFENMKYIVGGMDNE